MGNLSSGLVNAHDQASTALGGAGSIKATVRGFWGRLTGKASGENVFEDEESPLSSSSTWSSDSAEDIKKRLMLRKRSWGAQDDLTDDSEKRYNEWLIVLVIRFLYGLGLSQAFYLLMTYHSSWEAHEAIWWSGIVGFPVAVGMAFSQAVRCVVALLLPTFCTSKGRGIILAFALMLLLTGPSVNIAYNYGEISRSLTCGDELGYNMTQGLKALVHNGQNAILSTMEDTIDTIADAVETAEEAFYKFAEKLQSVAEVIRHMNDFIRNMGSVCSDKLGAFLCIIPNFVAKQAKKLITDPVKDAIKQVKAEFEFNMSFSHEFRYDVNSSKTVSEITSDILGEIRETISGITDIFAWARFAMLFSTVFVILKAIKYRYKYLTSIEFDNCYVTTQLEKLDKKRRRSSGISVFPLRAKENSKFISPSRIWMSRPEIKKFSKGFSSISFHTFYTAAVIFVDYSLWWLLHEMAVSLSLRREAGTLLEKALTKGASKVMGESFDGQGKEIVAKLVGLAIGGYGFLSIIYRAIASAMQRLASSEGYGFSIENCLPNPRPPDYKHYAVIISLFVLLYLICLTESYILRLRRVIMSKFYPKREKARILFLRAKILSSRGLSAEAGLVNAVKRACCKVNQSKAEDQNSLLGRLSHRRGILGWCARLVSCRNRFRCNVCRLAGGKQHSELFVRCPTFGCKAVYCVECYEDLHRLCIICLVKESKVVRKRRKRKVATSSSQKPDSEQSRIAEILVESSGISDSSDSSSPEEDESNEDEGIKITKSVRFEKNIKTRYMPISNRSGSETDDQGQP